MTRRPWLTVIGVLLVAAPLVAQPPAPWKVQFTASPDHAAVANDGQPLVTRYELFLSRSGTRVAGPVDLDKPTPDAQGVITVDINATILPLAAGTYTAIVDAVGPAGVGASAPSSPFSLTGPMRAPSAPGSPTVLRQ